MGRACTHPEFHASEAQEGEETSQYLRAAAWSPRGQAMPRLRHDPEVLLDFISLTCVLNFFFFPLSYISLSMVLASPVKIKDYSNF